jgi:hypothetical protein
VWLHSRSVSGPDTPIWTLRFAWTHALHSQISLRSRSRRSKKDLPPGVAGCPTPRWHRRIRRSKPEPVNKQSCQHKYGDEDDGLGADVLKDNQWSPHTPLRRLVDRSRPQSRTTTESLAIVKPSVEDGEPRGPANAAITTTATPLSFVVQDAYVAWFALPLFETDR